MTALRCTWLAVREWCPKGQPEEVKVHDFIDRELGKAIPYGVYELTANANWVSVSVDHTARRDRRLLLSALSIARRAASAYPFHPTLERRRNR